MTEEMEAGASSMATDQVTVAEDVAPARTIRKDAARNRELLIAAAREVFARRGIEASLDDVAHRAGLGVGTAYRHFANKYELLTALMAQTIDEIVEQAEYAATLEDPWQALVTFFEAALTVQAKDRGLREVMMGVHDPDKIEQVQDRISVPLNDIVRRARRAHVVRRDLEPSDIGMIIAMLCTVADISGDTDPELWRRYLALCLDGLRPDAPKLPVKALDEAQMRRALATHKSSHGNETRTSQSS
jgi:AcrR family transcriptional regulator